MRVAELQMYRETAFEQDGRHSNENAPRVYLQRPLSQAEADVADLYTIIIMSKSRRSCAQKPISYADGLSSDDRSPTDVRLRSLQQPHYARPEATETW